MYACNAAACAWRRVGSLGLAIVELMLESVLVPANWTVWLPRRMSIEGSFWWIVLRWFSLLTSREMLSEVWIL